MIYLNNAATSFPKPACVAEAMAENLRRPPCNPYRDNGSNEVADVICRKRLAKVFGMDEPTRIVLCSGATEALNIAIQGLLREGGHVVTTQVEHNSVLRPLYFLQKQGRIKLSIVPCDPCGRVAEKDIAEAIRKSTCMIAVNHCSNVTGCLQDVDSIYGIAASRGIPLLIDASQSAGTVSLEMRQKPGAVTVFTGHKGLLGPSGTGGLALGSDVQLRFWKVGGTGIRSDLQEMPEIMPLKYEPGTPNQPGIAGLAAALGYLEENPSTGIKSELVEHFSRESAALPGVRIYSAEPAANPCGVVGFRLDGWNSKEVGYVLQESYDIRVRTGLHCAPLIHQAMGTFPEGTVRVSFCANNTHAEVEQLMSALKALAR